MSSPVFKPIKWSKGRLRGTAWILVSQGGRLLMQAGTFATVARTLGAREFGEFAGSLALVATVLPFAGWGSGHLLVMRVSREPKKLSEYWGHVILTTAISSVLLLGLALVAVVSVFPRIPLRLVCSLGIAELVFGRLAESSSLSFLAVEQQKESAQAAIVVPALRFWAAVSFAMSGCERSGLLWSWYYLCATVVGGTALLVYTSCALSRPRFRFDLLRSEFSTGWHFAASLAFSSIYTDIDKVMLVNWSTPVAAAIYTAAYRVVALAFVPVKSVLIAIYNDFFRWGSKGILSAFEYARTLMPWPLVYSTCAAASWIVAAPVIPRVLGHDYALSVSAVRWLAILTILQSLHYFAADILTASNYQKVRTLAQGSVAVINVGVNAWLIPSYSWRGAAWSSVISDGMLAAVLWSLVVICIERERNGIEYAARSREGAGAVRAD
jgi:O-antigen/teichoic acid export membrane protein